MSKIEVGEYVRTKTGIISKLESIEIESNEKYYWFEKTIYYSYEDAIDFLKEEEIEKHIKAHSKNIIDLIEEEDIVILEYYVSRYRKRIQRKFEVETLENDMCFLNHRCSFLYDREKQKFIDGKGFNIKIKSILTHEQYEQNCYKVGDIE